MDDYFFLVSYYGSTYDKLEKSLNAHSRIQKIQRKEKKKVYFNCLDVENSKDKHKYIFGGAWHFDVCLENYEIASNDILKNYFVVYYLDEKNEYNDNLYLGYRLRRIYEMIDKTKKCVIFFNNDSNFNRILDYLEIEFELDNQIQECKEYKSTIMGYEKCEKDKYYFDLIKKKFPDKILV